MWKTLSSKKVIDNKNLVIVEDKVLLPSGIKITYLKFEYKTDAVLTIVTRKDGKILLEKEYSYPQNTELYQFPAGALNEGEKPFDGANRELVEETGIRSIRLEEIGVFLLDNRHSSAKVHVFLGEKLEVKSLKPQTDREESIKSFWFSETEIDNMIRNGDIFIFPVLSAWSLYKLRKR
jgi:ADP-ribose pyrophosphatase